MSLPDEIQDAMDDLMTAQKYLLEEAIRFRKSHPTIGGLFHEVANGNFVLTGLIEKLDADEVWDCIDKVLARINVTNNDEEFSMFLHQTIKCTPQYITKVYSTFPDSLAHRDKDNRLPIHVDLDKGME